MIEIGTNLKDVIETVSSCLIIIAFIWALFK